MRAAPGDRRGAARLHHRLRARVRGAGVAGRLGVTNFHTLTMRVIEATPPRVRRSVPAAARRLAQFERLGLVVTSVVFITGVALTYQGQTQEFATIDGLLSAGRVVN